MSDKPNQPIEGEILSEKLTSDGAVQTKFLAQVFGIMFLALLATAGVTLGFTYLFRTLYGVGSGISAEGYTILTGICLGSLFFLLIYSFVASFIVKSGKGLIPLFLLYVVVMGIFFSSFLVFIETWTTMAQALGISALAFFSMFLIGYFAKGNLGWLSLIALGLLFGALMMSIFYGIWYWVSGYIYWMDVGISAIVLIAVMLLTAVSANRMKKTLQAGGIPTKSLVLYFAFDMYVNFINILIRVFYILLASKNR